MLRVTYVAPAQCLVERSRLCVLASGEPQDLEALSPEPLNHFGVKPRALTEAFVFGMHEEGPNVAICGIANGERRDTTFGFDDPTATRLLNLDLNIVFSEGT
jgi:hypothetical protein